MSNPRINVARRPPALDEQELPSPPAKPIDERLQKLVDKALYAGGRPQAQRLRNFLNGTWLGVILAAKIDRLQG